MVTKVYFSITATIKDRKLHQIVLLHSSFVTSNLSLLLKIQFLPHQGYQIQVRAPHTGSTCEVSLTRIGTFVEHWHFLPNFQLSLHTWPSSGISSQHFRLHVYNYLTLTLSILRTVAWIYSTMEGEGGHRRIIPQVFFGYFKLGRYYSTSKRSLTNGLDDDKGPRQPLQIKNVPHKFCLLPFEMIWIVFFRGMKPQMQKTKLHAPNDIRMLPCVYVVTSVLFKAHVNPRARFSLCSFSNKYLSAYWSSAIRLVSVHRTSTTPL